MTTADIGGWIERWLSAPRFAVYLEAAGHDRTGASALYEWNTLVASAIHHDLAHLEIGLRNAYDRVLCRAAPKRRLHWVFEPERHFPPQRHKAANGQHYDANEKSRNLIDQAVKSASPNSHPSARSASTPTRPPAGKVIAELSFGFWRYLSSKRQHDPLWVPYLHRAFPPGTSRLDVDRPIGRLHDLRNRVAHHEPLLRVNLADRHGDLLNVASLISPELAAHITANSALPRLLTTRPSRPR